MALTKWTNISGLHCISKTKKKKHSVHSKRENNVELEHAKRRSSRTAKIIQSNMNQRRLRLSLSFRVQQIIYSLDQIVLNGKTVVSKLCNLVVTLLNGCF